MLYLRYILVILCLVSIQVAFAKSPVWKISSEGNTLYLGGTVHLLRPSDYPLPTAFEYAYENADEIVFETDMQKMQSPAFQQKAASQLVYSEGRSLKDVISSQTYKKLKAYTEKRHLPIERFILLKPGMLVVTLTVMELQRIGISADYGVDQFYSAKSIADKKMLGKLETLDEQLDFFLQMGKGNEDKLVEKTLSDLEAMPAMMKSMLQYWRNGNHQGLNQLISHDFQKTFPKLYQKLNVDRNKAWLPKIKEMLADDNTEFVLVGALHLLGKHGLLAGLKEQGYKVEQLN